MPLYEDKLISPLVVRFTQNRIRTTFRDGREVESTIKELVTSPCEGEYDIIIDAPFPPIEIIRWAPHGRKKSTEEHWFTFDNRRLYCLQRFAVECWPQRVAAKVEVMYADAGSIRKKLDTQSQGMSVVIGHAFATEDELIRWSWRSVVQARAPPGVVVSMTKTYIAADDAKTSLRDLADVPDSTLCTRQIEFDSAANSTNIVTEQSDEQGYETNNGQNLQDQNIAPSLQDESLTGLIGKLLILTEDESSKGHRSISNGTDSIQFSSTCVSESDSLGSADEVVESVASHRPMEHEALINRAGRGQTLPGKKTQKMSHRTRVPQHKWPANEAAQAAQIQIAQYQMAQWQAYAVGMAGWQQAAFALPPCQIGIVW